MAPAGDGWLASVRPAAAHRDQRLDSLRRLAGGVAHDINNLLGVVLNYAAFIAEATSGTAAAAMDPADAGSIRGDAEQIVRAAERATALSRRLLGFAGREPAQAVPVDLSEVVRDAAAGLRATLGDIPVDLRLAADLPAVTADPAQLGRILADLVDNAHDAMPHGGRVTITTDAGPDGAVRLTVHDTGTGMPPDVLDRAVEPFYTTRPGRPGLGLSTVYGLVSRAGAELLLASEPGGGGSTVRVIFPADPAN